MDRQAGAWVCNIIHGWSYAWCADVSVSGGKEAQGQSDIPWPSRRQWVEQSLACLKRWRSQLTWRNSSLLRTSTRGQNTSRSQISSREALGLRTGWIDQLVGEMMADGRPAGTTAAAAAATVLYARGRRGWEGKARRAGLSGAYCLLFRIPRTGWRRVLGSGNEKHNWP